MSKNSQTKLLTGRLVPRVFIHLVPSTVLLFPDDDFSVVRTRSQNVAEHWVSPCNLPHGTFMAIRKQDVILGTQQYSKHVLTHFKQTHKRPMNWSRRIQWLYILDLNMTGMISGKQLCHNANWKVSSRICKLNNVIRSAYACSVTLANIWWVLEFPGVFSSSLIHSLCATWIPKELYYIAMNMIITWIVRLTLWGLLPVSVLRFWRQRSSQFGQRSMWPVWSHNNPFGHHAETNTTSVIKV